MTDGSHAAPPRLPGLDSLRGVAVAAVVAYHLGYLPGGFLGVDIFFVLSGYLITSLALGEVDRTGRLGLRSFWGRRVRRLAPALFVMVPAVLGLSFVVGWDRSAHGTLAWDATATLSWWMNWREALGGSGGYWAPAPSPFRHAWSLSIEEQFYAAWPLALTGAFILARRVGRPAATVVAATAGLLAAASATWSIVLSHRLDPAELSRVYLGTDTRIVAPLVGCAIAAILHRRPRNRSTGRADIPSAIVGLAAAAALVSLMATVDVDDPSHYRFGMLPAAAVLAGLVLLSARRITRTDPVTGWLGRRSYAIYLWSWPIQILLIHDDPTLGRGAVALITIPASLVLAELSWRLIEQPAQRYTGWASQPRGRRTVASSMGVVAVATTIAIMATAAPPPLHERSVEDTVSDALRPEAVPTTSPEAEPEDDRVMTIGDSTMYSATIHAPHPSELPGIASIDNRAANGCGLLAPIGYGYPESFDGDPFPVGSDRFVVPTKCAPMDDAIDIGLAAQPTVVLSAPGAWEIGRVMSPDGEVIEAKTPRMAELLTDRLLDIARRVDASGSRMLLVPFACAGPRPGYEWAADPDAIRWINGVSAGVLAIGRDGGLAIDMADVPPEVCEGGDPTAPATPAKNLAMGDEIHVAGPEGGLWLWSTWWAPAIAATTPGTDQAD